MKVVTDPVQALVDVGKENSELHEELVRVYREMSSYVKALTVIAGMPNEAAPIASRALQRRPLDA